MELEPAAVVTIVVSQDIWLYVLLWYDDGWVLMDSSVLAQVQLAQAVFRVLAVVLVLLAVGLEADLPLVVDLLVDPALLPATSAVDQTILLVTARLRP